MPVTWWLTSRGSEANTRSAPPFLSSFLYASFSPSASYIIHTSVSEIPKRMPRYFYVSLFTGEIEKRAILAYNEAIDNFR